mmetsp:Transcript_129899/g.416854  ORF Transcript_129899/g.416854 Transcript_129899/m.416854 type:complete len:405 (+) Transcript_129899:202-1416(+)
MSLRCPATPLRDTASNPSSRQAAFSGRIAAKARWTIVVRLATTHRRRQGAMVLAFVAEEAGQALTIAGLERLAVGVSAANALAAARNRHIRVVPVGACRASIITMASKLQVQVQPANFLRGKGVLDDADSPQHALKVGRVRGTMLHKIARVRPRFSICVLLEIRVEARLDGRPSIRVWLIMRRAAGTKDEPSLVGQGEARNGLRHCLRRPIGLAILVHIDLCEAVEPLCAHGLEGHHPMRPDLELEVRGLPEVPGHDLVLAGDDPLAWLSQAVGECSVLQAVQGLDAKHTTTSWMCLDLQAAEGEDWFVRFWFARGVWMVNLHEWLPHLDLYVSGLEVHRCGQLHETIEYATIFFAQRPPVCSVVHGVPQSIKPTSPQEPNIHSCNIHRALKVHCELGNCGIVA